MCPAGFTVVGLKVPVAPAAGVMNVSVLAPEPVTGVGLKLAVVTSPVTDKGIPI
jgi:hypothetical protein